MSFRKHNGRMIGVGMFLFLLLAYSVGGLGAQPAEGIEKRKIAVLESISGEVIIKSRGLWGNTPKPGMDLHHGDKIVCQEASTVTIRFLDGAVLEVKPNSTIRIAEDVTMGGSSGKDQSRREARLFIGKARYQSGNQPAMETVLVAPAAVAALRGTEAWFGSDGKHSFFDQISGDKELKGNISEGFVPEISKPQAEADSNYKACLDSNRVWIKYLKTAARAGLFSENSQPQALYLAQSGGSAHDGKPIADDGANEKLIEAMGLLAEYSLIHSKETEIENTSLLNHPDKKVFDRAVKALNESKLALVRSQEALNFNVAIKHKTKQRLQLWKRYDQNKRSVISDLIKIKQKSAAAHELAAFVGMLSAEEYTIGLGKAGLTIKHLWPQIEQAAQQSAQDYEKGKALADRILESAKWGKTEEARAKQLQLYSADSAANAAVANAIAKAAYSIMIGDEIGTKRFMALIDETVKTRNEVNELVKQAENLIRTLPDPSEDPEAIDRAMETLDKLNITAEQKLHALPKIVSEPLAPKTEGQTTRDRETGDQEAEETQPPGTERQESEMLRPEVVIVDADGDGYPAGVDCDDLDPLVHPGAEEICGDGIDNNCDGIIDNPPCRYAQ